MAFDQSTRNRLQKFVSNSRTLLSEEFTRQLQNDYGLDPSMGTVSPLENLGHLNDTRRETARILRDTLAHYLASSPSGGVREALERIIREQAFTVLNRLSALRMTESRGILIESVGNGYQSRGFQLYERLAGSGLGETGDTYRCYLFSIFDEFALDLKVLFDRFSPQGRLFPRETALLDLLKLLNDPELAHLWAKDETIGWIYQYFNSKEERKKMRDESAAPRNSRELAVRNQFFTPRYVVEFLTDNTLGRIWYEMTQGETGLKDFCRYLVRRPAEIFLKPGEAAPVQAVSDENLSQEELLRHPVHILYRPLKDPRTIRMLDPACGSMHFGLYSFDLFERIYDEAWELELRLGGAAFVRETGFKPLTETYSDKEAFLRDVPRLIIEYNIHGIDIDPRAVQIAGLSLWLRAQRSWHNQGVKPTDRPRITRSNIVCAEPMPGEKELLREFTARLDEPALGYLLEQVFDKMQLAGEAGSLLKIEEEIRDIIAEAKRRWKAVPKLKQIGFFGDATNKPEQAELPIDFTGITDERFWEGAEEKLYQALQEYAEVVGDHGYQRRLFAEDTARGFAFINQCRKRYDAILMNPPFGEASYNTGGIIESRYAHWNSNLLCAFLERGWNWIDIGGCVGIIFDRTAIVKSTYEKFRRYSLVVDDRLFGIVDLGWGVLDANVEVTTIVLHRSTAGYICTATDLRTVPPDKKGEILLNRMSLLQKNIIDDFVFVRAHNFNKLPNVVIGYDFPIFLQRAFSKITSLEDNGYKAYQGHALKSEKHFRVWWEVMLCKNNYSIQRLFNGAGFSPYGCVLLDTVISPCKLEDLPKDTATVLRNTGFQGVPGLCFGKRGDYFCTHILPAGHVFTVEGQAIPMKQTIESFELIGFLNTPLVRFSLNKYCGQHKYSGYVNLLPFMHLPETLIISEMVYTVIKYRAIAGQYDELQHFFIPTIKGNSIAVFAINISNAINVAISKATDCEEYCHQQSLLAFNVSPSEKKLIEDFRNRQPIPESPIEDTSSNDDCTWFAAHSGISISLGSILGRWDIRFATGEKPPPELPDPFAPLPVCSPGMLQSTEGLLAEPQDVPADYPFRISWSAILVDEEGHAEDIVSRVREAIEVIWKEKAGDIEHEACEILGVRSLRDYFAKPSDFFADHLKRYSKSRRQAPIYWPLSTASGSYTLWIYYHRLNDQTLYTCVNDFVEPKLRDIAIELTTLRQNGIGRSRDDEKKLENLQDFEIELQEFRDELLHVARLPWKPNLNDGVQITAAPLWKLFQLPKWKKTLKETWEKLEKDDYDWAHLAYSIWPDRVREKCKKDKSLAIAHNLEELYEEPPASAKKKRSKKAVVV
jgi:hypothetical protein